MLDVYNNLSAEASPRKAKEIVSNFFSFRSEWDYFYGTNLEILPCDISAT